MAKKTTPPKRQGGITALRWTIGVIVVLVLIGAILDLLDLRVRKTTVQTSVYTFHGTVIDFSGMSNGAIDVTAGQAGRITVTHKLAEGIRKLRVSDQVRGNTLAVQESGGCNDYISLGLFGSCTSDYQVQVPAGTAVITHAQNANISVDGVDGNHELQTSNGNITVRDLTNQYVTAATDNGDVTASNVTTGIFRASSNNGNLALQLLGSPNNVAAHSDNGAVTIQLQDTKTAYKTAATSNNGKVTTTIKTDPSNAKHAIEASSNNGDVVLKY